MKFEPMIYKFLWQFSNPNPSSPNASAAVSSPHPSTAARADAKFISYFQIPFELFQTGKTKKYEVKLDLISLLAILCLWKESRCRKKYKMKPEIL